MKFLALAAAALAVLAPAFAQDKLQVDTVAGINQCQPVLFTWHGGQGPYFLSLLPAAQPSAPALKQFPQQTGTSFTWLVDLPTGSTFTISLKDSTGATAFSDIETVNAGGDATCLNTAVTDDGQGGTAAPSNTATDTTSGGSTATTTPASGSPSPTASTPTSAPTSSSSSNSGMKNTAGSFGIAALMGLIGAALF